VKTPQTDESPHRELSTPRPESTVNEKVSVALAAAVAGTKRNITITCLYHCI